jgi:predicted RNase H-like HicB family nuclease
VAACTIRVERLADGRYRGSCTPFPECTGVGRSEDEARRIVEENIGRRLAEELGQRSSASTGNEPPA